MPSFVHAPQDKLIAVSRQVFSTIRRSRIAMHLRLKRTPGLYLAGFMGCGKTTVGRLLAEELGWCFIDIDADIEAQEGKTIAQIFAEHGEAAFREKESDVIRNRVSAIEAGEPCVVALGGGAFVIEPNWELIERNGITIWLDCPLDRLWKRVEGDAMRPLAVDPENFERLFESRRPLYARAHFHIDASADNPPEIVRQILLLPIF